MREGWGGVEGRGEGRGGREGGEVVAVDSNVILPSSRNRDISL